MWLIQEDVGRELRKMAENGLQPTAEQQRAHEDRVSAQMAADPRNMRRAGRSLDIHVEGVLTKRPSLLAMLFGGGNTTYEDIQRSIHIARADDSVTDVRFVVDSPGGQVDGLFDALAAIEELRAEKKVSVLAYNAASAAYGIAAAAGPIEAKNAASRFGSVGVAVDAFVTEDIVSITNSDSPNKRPDITTEEGRAVVVRELDALHEVFVDAIARGRGTDTDDVVENFGRGAMMLAGEAKRRGMIDRVAKPKLRAARGPRAEAPSAAGGGVPTTRDRTMTEDELRAQHPQLYAAVFNAGKKAGAADERDRCVAHLTMGEKSGDMTTAIEAVQSGEGMTMTLQARYMSAAMNRNDRDLRQEESDDAAVAVDGLDPAANEEGPDLGDQVVALLEGKDVAHG